MNPFPTLKTLQTLLQEESLQLFLQQSWGRQNENYREKIHHELNLQKALFSDTSTSHTDGLGGFAAIQNGTGGKKLGFDIELFSRVTEEVAKRISSYPEELSQAPSAAHLWVAKEATFKALKGPHQPRVISQVGIENWQSTASQIETFQLVGESTSKGIVFRSSLFIFGIFIFSPQNRP